MNKMIEAYKNLWLHYIDFSGRTDVPGFWWALLADLIICAALSIITFILPFLGFVTGLYGLATLIPGIAIFVRRMNDCGRHWANIFWALLPIVGLIILIIRACEKSK